MIKLTFVIYAERKLRVKQVSDSQTQTQTQTQTQNYLFRPYTLIKLSNTCTK